MCNHQTQLSKLKELVDAGVIKEVYVSKECFELLSREFTGGYTSYSRSGVVLSRDWRGITIRREGDGHNS